MSSSRRKPRQRSQPSRLEAARLRAEAARPETTKLSQLAPQGPRRRVGIERTGFVLAAGGAAVAAMSTWYLGSPLLGAGWRPLWLAGGLLVTLTLAGLAVRLRTAVSSRGGKAVGAVAVGLVVLFFAGAVDQVVIDGRVHLSSSEEAQAMRLANEIEADLSRLAELDAMLANEQADARAALATYGPASIELRTISAKYSAMRTVDLPSPMFEPVVRTVAAAAEFGARAMDAKAQLTVTYDARVAANLDSWRSTFIEGVLTAGPELAQLARYYGFELGSATGPVE